LRKSTDGHSRISMCMKPRFGQPSHGALDDRRDQEEATEHDQCHDQAGDCCYKTVDNRLCARERWAEVEIHRRFQDCDMTSQYGAATGVDLAKTLVHRLGPVRRDVPTLVWRRRRVARRRRLRYASAAVNPRHSFSEGKHDL
jgi:hypothetical protein